ncbi:twin-arginine translocase subunit TatC [Acinetobacter shaoyimingii]|uniref:twin-arginine translocase subunit TatC n=1 Tax=Acinetobacter shaoyimingii TaxID=2715164 RepID=UPI001D0E2732|nr:twin-arginine translocase subunit TatC [Acinetobacter shaoyimingii]
MSIVREAMIENKSEVSIGEKKSNFSVYFTEFRKILIQILVTFFALFLCLTPFAKKIYTFLALPLQHKLPAHAHMIATDITSTFIAPFKLVFFVVLALLVPFIFFKLYSFIKSALFINEKKVFFLFFPLSIFLFYSGVGLGYFTVLPTVLNFFIGMAPEAVIPMTDINEYLMFCIKFFLILGLVFQLPLLILILVYFHIIPIETLTNQRKYIFVGCFFVAMFITPPDILSMGIAALFMYLLFELGIILSKIVIRITKKQ